jgi:hypothetical protein
LPNFYLNPLVNATIYMVQPLRREFLGGAMWANGKEMCG